MKFYRKKYIASLSSPSNIIQIGDYTTLDFIITEIYQESRDFTAEIRITGGNNREQTIILDFMPLFGDVPLFQYTSDFASFTPCKASIDIKIVDSEGNSYLIDEKINVEFVS